MKNLNSIFLYIFAISITLFFCSCEKYIVSDDINGLIRINDLSLNVKVEDSFGSYTIEKIYENAGNYNVKISITDTFSLRGEAAIKPGEKYRLSFVMKNIDADPVINYSFWKKPETSLRYYTFKGETGNPPTSITQKPYNEWTIFNETFETREGEDSFMLTLHSGKGIFYIREMNIEVIK